MFYRPPILCFCTADVALAASETLRGYAEGFTIELSAKYGRLKDLRHTLNQGTAVSTDISMLECVRAISTPRRSLTACLVRKPSSAKSIASSIDSDASLSYVPYHQTLRQSQLPLVQISAQNSSAHTFVHMPASCGTLLVCQTFMSTCRPTQLSLPGD